MIDVAFDDVSRLGASLSELADRFSDLTPFWNDFAVGLVSSRLRDVFLTEGYGTWPPLDPAYAAAKAAAYPGSGLLRRSGTYFEAATSPGHPGHIFVATPSEMVFGIDESYFVSRFGENYPARHESGRGVAVRSVFGLAAADEGLETEISELLTAWSADAIAEWERGFR